MGFALIEALGPATSARPSLSQTVAPVAIEAAEGTDMMLDRLARLRKQGLFAGPAVCSSSRRNRDRRSDRSARYRSANRGGCRCSRSRWHRGCCGPGAGGRAGRCPVTAGPIGPVSCRRDAGHEVRHTRPRACRYSAECKPGRRDRRDARRGLDVITAAAQFEAGAGAIVARHHVLAVEAGEGIAAMIAASRTSGRWGDQGSRRRRGVLALRSCRCSSRRSWCNSLRRAGGWNCLGG